VEVASLPTPDQHLAAEMPYPLDVYALHRPAGPRGHGQPEKLSAVEAIEVAKSSTPLAASQEVFQDEHGIALGSHVTITAESFGLESTPGKLIAATRTRYTLERSDERAGLVHVHFPRVGYVLQKIEN
jgi:hypothetical protein